MDAAPRDRSTSCRVDPELGLPVPFACGTDDPYARPGGPRPRLRTLDKRRVTQCALSRVCGVCGSGLGRPIAFLGTEDEVDRNAFHFPPTHLECAERAASTAYAGRRRARCSARTRRRAEWHVVTTAGFEFVRPSREDVDRRPTFQPNSLLG